MSDKDEAEITIEEMHKGFNASKKEAEEIINNKKETEKILSSCSHWSRTGSQKIIGKSLLDP